MTSLHSVFRVMVKHHLTLNGEKCVFAAPAIEFVGIRLSADGTYPLHSNGGHPPCPRAHLSRSGGLLPAHDSILSPFPATVLLHNRATAKAVEKAGSGCLPARKSQLTSPPVLAQFDLASPTHVTCDASALAIGAVMSQLQGRVERPISSPQPYGTEVLSGGVGGFSVPLGL